MKYGLLKVNSKTIDIVEHNGDTLRFLQEKVGGYIEKISLKCMCGFNLPTELNNIVAIINEEGKTKQLPANIYLPSDLIVGDIVLAALEFNSDSQCDEIVGLSDKQLELLPNVIEKLREESDRTQDKFYR